MGIAAIARSGSIRVNPCVYTLARNLLWLEMLELILSFSRAHASPVLGHGTGTFESVLQDWLRDNLHSTTILHVTRHLMSKRHLNETIIFYCDIFYKKIMRADDL